MTAELFKNFNHNVNIILFIKPADCNKLNIVNSTIFVTFPGTNVIAFKLAFTKICEGMSCQQSKLVAYIYIYGPNSMKVFSQKTGIYTKNNLVKITVIR